MEATKSEDVFFACSCFVSSVSRYRFCVFRGFCSQRFCFRVLRFMVWPFAFSLSRFSFRVCFVISRFFGFAFQVFAVFLLLCFLRALWFRFRVLIFAVLRFWCSRFAL